MKKIELTDSYNYSIAFLKAFFSFVVVCCHFYSPENTDFYPIAALCRIKSVAVPSFMIISFLLTSKIFQKQDDKALFKRVRRLLIPFWGWAVLYYFGFLLLTYLLEQFGFEGGLRLELSFKDLVWQMLLGHSPNICPPLWFQFNLIVFTIFFYYVFKFGDKYAVQALLMLLVIALWFQYSGKNIQCFGGYEFNIRYPVGRIAEVFPFAVIGYILFITKAQERIKKHRYYVCTICAFAAFVVAHNGLFTGSEGFGYGGTYLLIYAELIFLLIYELPFEKLSYRIKGILRFLSKYSMGVYCLHFGIGYCVNATFCRKFGWRTNTFAEACCIYVISVLISFAISKIPTRYAKQLVE